MQRPSWGLLRARWLMGISLLLLPLCSLSQGTTGFSCGIPPNIVNGYHNGTGSSLHAVGTVIKYTCRDNFSLIGAHSIFCGIDGDTRVWKGKLPKCKGFVFILLIAASLLIFLWLPAQSLYVTLCSK